MGKKSRNKPKRRARHEKWTGFNQFCASIKESYVGAFCVALVGFVLIGIGNAMLAETFGVCAATIKDTSRTVFQRIVDTYYIHAAKGELTDIIILPALFMMEGFILLVWYSVDTAKYLFRKMESDYKEILDIEKRLKTSETESNAQDESATADAMKERVQRLKHRIGKQIPVVRMVVWLLIVLSIASTSLIVYDFSSTMFSYQKVKRFHRSVAEIRPFITDEEYYQLHRRWVKMKSRNDYKDINRTIDEYGKRAESGIATIENEE